MQPLGLSLISIFTDLYNLLNQKFVNSIFRFVLSLFFIGSSLGWIHFNKGWTNFISKCDFGSLFDYFFSLCFFFKFGRRVLRELLLSDFPLFLDQSIFSSYLSASLANCITRLDLFFSGLSDLIDSICCWLFIFTLLSFCH